MRGGVDGHWFSGNQLLCCNVLHQDVGGRLKIYMRKGRCQRKCRKIKKMKEEEQSPRREERNEKASKKGELPGYGKN
jgi:hypothetical protein